MIGCEWLSKYGIDLKLLEQAKHGQVIPTTLSEVYVKLNDVDRGEMLHLIGSWLFSNSAEKRYDARFIISKNNIIELLPTLKSIKSNIMHSADISFKYEIDLIADLILKLEKASIKIISESKT
ncbi:hypothetical protein AB4238_15020 [Shewanella sp. 10N.286.45.A1]|uniref:hypothetical protein n=1 Tax=Shewanella sp. 10N.286.45.A1 TaxID=3229694 RepID=UPI003554322A